MLYYPHNMANSAKQIADLIDRFEVKTEAELVTPAYLTSLRQQLTHIALSTEVRDDLRYRQYSAELHALIDGAESKDDEAVRQITTALSIAGSPDHLRSRLLQNYLRSHPETVPALAALQTKHLGPGDLSLLSQREQKWMRRRGLGGTPEVNFLIRNPWIFAAAYILSGSMYGVYVTYKNWQAIRDASGRRISPFWRTFFLIFYLWPLFKTAILLAKTRGFKVRYSGGILFLLYLLVPFLVGFITLFFSTSGPWAHASQILFYGVQILCFILAGRAARSALSKQPQAKPRPFNWVEWLFVIVGVLALVVSQAFYHLERQRFDSNVYKNHSGWQAMQIVSAQSQHQVLDADYQHCEAYLKHESNISTYQVTSEECNLIGQRANQAQEYYDSLLDKK